MSLPAELTEILADQTAEAWERIAPVLPPGCRLFGGTALAVHLGHRESHDLDFCFDDPDLDLPALERALAAVGELAVTRRSPGTLDCQFLAAKLQFLHAGGQRDIDDELLIQGIKVLGLADLLAMKVKVIGDRGELRDYYDLKKIEQLTGRSVDEGIGLYLARYGLTAEDATIPHILQSLGYLDDVDEDLLLPESKAEIAAYWQRRQPQVLRSVSRHGGARAGPPAVPGPLTPPECTRHCHLSALPVSQCACACGGTHHGGGRDHRV